MSETDVLQVKLPHVIFISSRNRVAAWTLANEIADLRSEAMACSFEEPLRGGILGTFFQCDPSLELEKDEVKLPGLSESFEGRPMTGGAFRLWYHHGLAHRFGADVLGRIMFERMLGNKDYFSTFVFADGDDDLLPDMNYIAKRVGPENCLLVRAAFDPDERKTFSHPDGVATLQVPSGTLKEFLETLHRKTATERTPA